MNTLPHKSGQDLALDITSLDDAVDAFEAAWSKTDCPMLLEFLPSRERPDYRETLIELIRVDMEFRWKRQCALTLDDYLAKFKSHEITIEELGTLAFEDYRLRHIHHQSVVPDTYRQQYGVDIRHWPRWSTTQASNGAGSDYARPGTIRLPQLGERFHGFELVGLLGQGAFGSVFLARQEDLASRFVALKVTEASDVEPFSLAKLQHTNIIPIYSMKRDQDGQSICMPFWGVATLRDLLHAAGIPNRPSSGKALISTVANRRAITISNTLTESSPPEIRELLAEPHDVSRKMPGLEKTDYQSTILWLMSKIADGLAYAHSRGIVHGDLKPANILISDDAQPMLLDFHLSQQRNADQNETLVGGTLPYLAPSQLAALLGEASGQIDEESDLFSLGVILFEAITGKLPYPVYDSNARDLSRMIEQRQKLPKFDDSIFRKAPSLAAIIECCLTHDSGRRYPNVGALRIDLDRHLNHLPLRHAPNRSLVERTQKWTARHPRICSFASATLAAMVLLAIGAWLVSDRLTEAARLRDSNASQQFIAQLDKAQLPWFDADLGSRHHGPQANRMDKLADLIQQRSNASAASYRTTLASLPQPMADRELSEFCFSQYLLAHSSGNPAESIAQLQFTIDVAGDRTPMAIYQSLAEALNATGQDERAKQLRLKLPENFRPLGINDQLLVSLEHLRRGETNSAIEKLRPLIGESPQNDRAWLLLGKANSESENYAAAEVCYQTAASLQPDRAHALMHLAADLLRQRRYSDAIPTLNEAIERDSKQAVAFLNRALAHLGQRQDELAKADLLQAIELGCQQTRVHYLLYQIEKRLGNNSQAKQSLAKFLKLTPTDPVSWLARGMARIHQGQPKLALQDFQAARAIDPKNRDALQNIATVEAEYLDHLPESIEAMSELVALDEQDLVSRVTRGVLYARAGDRNRALADATFALKRSASADTLYRVSGVFALTSHQYPSDKSIALRLLRQAAAKDPEVVLQRHTEDQDLDPLRDDESFQKLINILTQLRSTTR